MEEEIKAYEAQNKTGNQVLDTVLTSKSLYCQQHNIGLTCVVDGTLLNFMDEMDLCTLFGNALDNAIESTVRLPETEQRLIHLLVTWQKSFLWIKVENTYDGKWKADGTLPKTTKADSRYHGYGLKSIFEIAEKYGGTASVTTRENRFVLKLLIPMRQESVGGGSVGAAVCFYHPEQKKGKLFVKFHVSENGLRRKTRGLRDFSPIKRSVCYTGDVKRAPGTLIKQKEKSSR